MNKEELELVIQAIEKLGDAGQNAFIWWLIINFLTSLLNPLTWIALFFTIAKITKQLSSTFSQANLEELKLRHTK